MSGPPPEVRDRFRHFQVIPTRRGDNDVYGHVNNVVYYAWFDTAVNGFLIGQGLLDIENSPVFGIVVETRCRYFRAFTYPGDVHAGLRVARLGKTSVVWEIGLFREGEDEAAALGHFVHVYVDRQSRLPMPVPDEARRILAGLLVGDQGLHAPGLLRGGQGSGHARRVGRRRRAREKPPPGDRGTRKNPRRR